jgi:hypothetical protein
LAQADVDSVAEANDSVMDSLPAARERWEHNTGLGGPDVLISRTADIERRESSRVPRLRDRLESDDPDGTPQRPLAMQIP